MDCRKTQALLDAFHDGELSDADRSRVENHLLGCTDCTRLLADLARADAAVGVPDPGQEYWDRFNARLADRIERAPEVPEAVASRPKPGWMRQQVRYLVPALAAAVLAFVVVRYSGTPPFSPEPPSPPAASAPTASAPERSAPETARKQAVGKRRDLPASEKALDAAVSRDAIEESKRAGAPVPQPLRKKTSAAPTPMAVKTERKSQEAAAEGSARADAAPAAAAPKIGPDPESLFRAREQRVSPCSRARTLAAQERLNEAEAAQRECLEQDPSPPTREAGLVFLAELLDRQARFDEADRVLSEVDRRFPESRPLHLYRQQRPLVQKLQRSVPVPR